MPQVVIKEGQVAPISWRASDDKKQKSKERRWEIRDTKNNINNYKVDCGGLEVCLEWEPYHKKILIEL